MLPRPYVFDRHPPVSVLAFDPGCSAETGQIACGVAHVEVDTLRPILLHDSMSIDGCLQLIQNQDPARTHVAIERVESYAIPGNDLLFTSEVVGELRAACRLHGLSWSQHFRRWVGARLQVGGLTGQARDTKMIRRVCEIVGERLDIAPLQKVMKGTKQSPGPLYGIKSHAWQAYALFLAVESVDAWDPTPRKPVRRLPVEDREAGSDTFDTDGLFSGGPA